METNLEIIRKECIAANPSILDLKFGCEVAFHHRPNEARIVVYVNKDKETDNTMLELLNMSGEFSNSIFKILGRPIRLADVLLAIENQHSYKTIVMEKIESLRKADKELDIKIRQLLDMYNLRNDDLTAQTPECISFLADLLAQK